MNLRTPVLLLLATFAATAAMALDERHIRDIERAETMSDLMTLADDITKSQAAKKPSNDAEATRIAADTQVYLGYIRVKQEEIVCGQLKALLEKEPPGFPSR